MKKALALLLVLVSMLLLAACGGNSLTAAAKDFTCGNMTVTLTEAFKETTADGYTCAYECDKVAVLVLEEKTAGTAAASWTLDDYAEAVLSMNASKNPGEIKKEEGLTYFEYNFNNTAENTVYSYFTAMYKAEGAFWMVQFACKEADFEECRPYFVTWAKSVKVA